jgi:hypothetical protein
MTPLATIHARALAAMTKPGPDMRRAIATAHSAATYAAIKERTGVMPKGLSRAERNDLKARVAEQITYYDKFAAQAGDMSEAGVLARAAMYAKAIKTTYEAARYPGLPFYPGEGSECLVNCRCSWNDEGGGVYHWILDAEESCPTCVERGGNNPYQVQ